VLDPQSTEQVPAVDTRHWQAAVAGGVVLWVGIRAVVSVISLLAVRFGAGPAALDGDDRPGGFFGLLHHTPLGQQLFPGRRRPGVLPADPRPGIGGLLPGGGPRRRRPDQQPPLDQGSRRAGTATARGSRAPGNHRLTVELGAPDRGGDGTVSRARRPGDRGVPDRLRVVLSARHTRQRRNRDPSGTARPSAPRVRRAAAETKSGHAMVRPPSTGRVTPVT